MIINFFVSIFFNSMSAPARIIFDKGPALTQLFMRNRRADSTSDTDGCNQSCVAGITVGAVALFIIIIVTGVVVAIKHYAPKPSNHDPTKTPSTADAKGLSDHGFSIHVDTVPMPASFHSAHPPYGSDDVGAFVFRVLPSPVPIAVDDHSHSSPALFDDSAPDDPLLSSAAGGSLDRVDRTPLAAASAGSGYGHYNSSRPSQARRTPSSIGRSAPATAPGPPRWFPPPDPGLTPPLPPWALTHIPRAVTPSPSAGLPPRDPGLDSPVPPWACAPGPRAGVRR
jgi:hypothetical protein